MDNITRIKSKNFGDFVINDKEEIVGNHKKKKNTKKRSCDLLIKRQNKI